MYNKLSLNGRIVLLLICASIILYFFIKNIKSALPKKILYASLFIALGMVSMACLEYLSQKHNIKAFDTLLFPIVNFDIPIIFLFLGSLLGLNGISEYICDMHGKNVVDENTLNNKKQGLFCLKVTFVIFFGSYVLLRAMIL